MSEDRCAYRFGGGSGMPCDCVERDPIHRGKPNQWGKMVFEAHAFVPSIKKVGSP